jgi:hypothetical protein
MAHSAVEALGVRLLGHGNQWRHAASVRHCFAAHADNADNERDRTEPAAR